MGFKLDRVHVWSGEVADQAGGVAAKLSLLASAGANLEFIYTRRQPDHPVTGMLYVAPLTGPLQVRAARSAGLTETHNPVVLRVEGDNQAGLGHRLTQQWCLGGPDHAGSEHVCAGRQVRRLRLVRHRRRRQPAAAILGDLGQNADGIAARGARSSEGYYLGCEDNHGRAAWRQPAVYSTAG